MRLLICLITLLFVTACQPPAESSRESGEKAQEGIMKRALAKVPVPHVSNFQTRDTVAKWMRRMDRPSKTFYVYLLADTGQTIGYYVAQTRPVSICAMLTPPDREVEVLGEPHPLGSAPALDGVYYGEGACSGVYFFDAETDAYVEISGMDYFVSDQPLSVDADPIRISGGP